MPLIPQAAGPPGMGGPPPELMALLAGGAGPGQAAPADQGAPPDAEAALRDVIQATHDLMALLPDAQDTQIVGQCLAQLTRIQAKMHQAREQAGTAGALVQRLGAATG